MTKKIKAPKQIHRLLAYDKSTWNQLQIIDAEIKYSSDRKMKNKEPNTPNGIYWAIKAPRHRKIFIYTSERIFNKFVDKYNYRATRKTTPLDPWQDNVLQQRPRRSQK
jgi:hypothetical protein